MNDDKKEQQIKPTPKITDDLFKQSTTTTKTVTRNDGVSDNKTRIDTYERKK